MDYLLVVLSTICVNQLSKPETHRNLPAVNRAVALEMVFCLVNLVIETCIPRSPVDGIELKGNWKEIKPCKPMYTGSIHVF